MKARTGGRRPNPDVPKAPAAFEPETWIDEGSVRAEAVAATQRATEHRVRKAPAVDAETAEAIDRVTTARRSERLRGRLVQAQESLDRDRFAEARRLGQSLLKELSDVPAVHEVVGLSSYRLGKWREAASALETQRAMTGGVRNHPVLADCYRALRKYDKVDELWAELREVSPNPELMAEGRIVAAGALADRGDLAGAIRLMSKTADSPRRVRDHHLKQWYVLADLYDRSGDVVKARHLFSRIRSLVPDYADVDDRLRGLGR